MTRNDYCGQIMSGNNIRHCLLRGGLILGVPLMNVGQPAFQLMLLLNLANDWHFFGRSTSIWGSIMQAPATVYEHFDYQNAWCVRAAISRLAVSDRELKLPIPLTYIVRYRANLFKLAARALKINHISGKIRLHVSPARHQPDAAYTPVSRKPNNRRVDAGPHACVRI